MAYITKELPLVPEPSFFEDVDAQVQPEPSSSKQSHTYTITFRFSFGTSMNLGDTFVGRVVAKALGVVIATGGFVISLVVIILAPLFPSLVSRAPAHASISFDSVQATSSPYRRRPGVAPIQVSVRRDPTVVSIIERGDSTSTAPNRRVSFSPQSSSTSVPMVSAVDMPSAPSSSNDHVYGSPSSVYMRSICDRVRDHELAYVLPTPPASITSASSGADELETFDEFGMVLGAGKRGKSLSFMSRRKEKGKEVVRQVISGSRKRSHSLGLAGSIDNPLTRIRPTKDKSGDRTSSDLDRPLFESEGEGSNRATDRDERASVDKESRRRSGISFQDFKAAFGKREGRHSLTPSALPSPPLTRQSLGIGRPSSVLISPRSVSDSITCASTKRRSLPLRIETGLMSPNLGRTELQSPSTLFGGGEVVIRNESGRLRTRTSAIPGLYAGAEVLQRL